MTMLDDLRGLAASAPSTLADGVLDRWVRVAGPPGEDTFDEVLVGFTAAGVRLVRPVLGADPDTDLDAFLTDYRERFGRPLRPAARPPRGVGPALAGRSAEGPVLDLAGLSPFAASVLEVTRRIPRGQTRPYAWVAREAGRPAAVRAAGTVLARNPVPLVVPCHRVTRTDGALGRYLFGTDRKAALLRGEGTDVAALDTLATRGVTLVGSDTTGVVCLPTCQHARRITDEHRHGFRDLATARAAGYRPCRDCRPGPADPARTASTHDDPAQPEENP